MTIAHGPIARKESRSTIAVVGGPLSLLGAGGLILAAMFLPVVQSSDATTTGYAIGRHERELSDLNASIYQLQADIAQLGSNGRIRQDAGALGMVPATKGAVQVSVNYAAPATVVLPRRFLPAPISAPPAPHHGPLWEVLHPLSPR